MGTDRLSRLRTAIASRIRRRLGVTGLDDSLRALEDDYESAIRRVWELLDGHEERIARIERLVADHDRDGLDRAGDASPASRWSR